jgi:hypothetical protein
MWRRVFLGPADELLPLSRAERLPEAPSKHGQPDGDSFFAAL